MMNFSLTVCVQHREDQGNSSSVSERKKWENIQQAEKCRDSYILMEIYDEMPPKKHAKSHTLLFCEHE